MLVGQKVRVFGNGLDKFLKTGVRGEAEPGKREMELLALDLVLVAGQKPGVWVADKRKLEKVRVFIPGGPLGNGLEFSGAVGVALQSVHLHESPLDAGVRALRDTEADHFQVFQDYVVGVWNKSPLLWFACPKYPALAVVFFPYFLVRPGLQLNQPLIHASGHSQCRVHPVNDGLFFRGVRQFLGKIHDFPLHLAHWPVDHL
jgi:hypothetical protein